MSCGVTAGGLAGRVFRADDHGVCGAGAEARPISCGVTAGDLGVCMFEVEDHGLCGAGLLATPTSCGVLAGGLMLAELAQGVSGVTLGGMLAALPRSCGVLPVYPPTLLVHGLFILLGALLTARPKS